LEVSFSKLQNIKTTTVFASPFSIQGDTLIYNTEDDEDDGIALGHAELLLDALHNNKDIKLIKLHSAGGVRIEAQYMADIIIDAGLDTHVDEECSSSCVRMFLAGKKITRTIRKLMTGTHLLILPHGFTMKPKSMFTSLLHT
jgi:hypothetical protein